MSPLEGVTGMMIQVSLSTLSADQVTLLGKFTTHPQTMERSRWCVPLHGLISFDRLTPSSDGNS